MLPLLTGVASMGCNPAGFRGDKTMAKFVDGPKTAKTAEEISDEEYRQKARDFHFIYAKKVDLDFIKAPNNLIETAEVRVDKGSKIHLEIDMIETTGEIIDVRGTAKEDLVLVVNPQSWDGELKDETKE